jgi:hypothetical protein
LNLQQSREDAMPLLNVGISLDHAGLFDCAPACSETGRRRFARIFIQFAEPSLDRLVE